MRKQVAALLGLLFTGAASAQSGTATLSWIPASTYVSGEPMTLASQRVYSTVTSEPACNITSPPSTPFAEVQTIGAGISTLVISQLWNGTYYWYVTSVDGQPREGGPSNIVCKRVSIGGNTPPPPVLVPNPPTNLTVQ